MRMTALVLVIVAAFALSATPAQATTTVVKDIPFDATIGGCGATITLSGTLQGVFTEQTLGAGGFEIAYHIHPQGVNGVSSDGANYKGTGGTRETTIFTPSGGLVDTYVNRFHIVGTGQAPSYYVKETFHLTVTPAGAISAFFDHFSLDCR
jgi:hypothetical protein